MTGPFEDVVQNLSTEDLDDYLLSAEFDDFDNLEELALSLGVSSMVSALLKRCCTLPLENRAACAKVICNSLSDELLEEIQHDSDLLRTLIDAHPNDAETTRVLSDFQLVSAADLEHLILKLSQAEMTIPAPESTHVLSKAILSAIRIVDITPEITELCLTTAFQDLTLQRVFVDRCLTTFSEKFDLNAQTELNTTAFLSVLASSPSQARRLLSKYPEKIDLLSTDSAGKNALQLAADLGHVEVFLDLLNTDCFAHGESDREMLFLFHQDRTKARTPVLFSVANSPEYAKLLRPYIEKCQSVASEKKLQKNDAAGCTVLQHLYSLRNSASTNLDKQLHKIEETILAGIPVDIASDAGHTLLMTASAQEPNATAVHARLRALGANPNLKINGGRSADEFKTVATQREPIKKRRIL